MGSAEGEHEGAVSWGESLTSVEMVRRQSDVDEVCDSLCVAHWPQGAVQLSHLRRARPVRLLAGERTRFPALPRRRSGRQHVVPPSSRARRPAEGQSTLGA